MANKAFNVTGAVAVQSAAHDRLQRAIENGTAVRILYNGAPYVTAHSVAAAKLFIGKSRNMTIVPYAVGA